MARRATTIWIASAAVVVAAGERGRGDRGDRMPVNRLDSSTASASARPTSASATTPRQRRHRISRRRHQRRPRRAPRRLTPTASDRDLRPPRPPRPPVPATTPKSVTPHPRPTTTSRRSDARPSKSAGNVSGLVDSRRILRRDRHPQRSVPPWSKSFAASAQVRRRPTAARCQSPRSKLGRPAIVAHLTIAYSLAPRHRRRRPTPGGDPVTGVCGPGLRNVAQDPRAPADPADRPRRLGRRSPS